MQQTKHQRDQINTTRRKGPARFWIGLLLLPLSGLFLVAPQASNSSETPDTPTGILGKEHKIIAKISKIAGETGKQIEDTGDVDREKIRKLHDFFKNFADRCHHAKEENVLFPSMRLNGIDEVTIDLVTLQHEEGRILLSGIEAKVNLPDDAMDKEQRLALARYLQEYGHVFCQVDCMMMLAFFRRKPRWCCIRVH